MAQKPTYEKLEQRIQELEKAALERQKVERPLEEFEQEKEIILKSLFEHVIYQDTEMRILWANRAACESVNMPHEQLLGRFCYEIWPKRSSPCPDCPLKKAMETGQPEQVEKSTPDGRAWFIRGYPVQDASGKIIGAIELTLDITDRKQAEQELRNAHDKLEQRVKERTAELVKANEELRRQIEERKRAEEQLLDREQLMKTILAVSPVGICLVRNRIIEQANRAMDRIWGYQEGSLVGKSTKVLYSDDEEYNRVGHEFYSEIEKKGLGSLETRWVTQDAREIQCLLQGSPLDPSDLSKGVIVAAMDITEFKRAENLVFNLSQMLMQAQERERQMISRELHDSIAQNLSTLKIGCDLIFDDQPAISHELKVKMAKYSNLIDQTISTVRNLAYDLRPPVLDEIGLVKALEIYCDEFSENSGIKVDFQSAGIHKLNFDSNTEIHLYRLVQEGLNNIRKHAHAAQATIKIVGAYPNIILRIEDDGQGFDVKARKLKLDKEKRMGLRSMKERVKLLQGRMSIQSRPTKGTKILITYPFKDKNNALEKLNMNHE
ncbi:MAG: PAS domain-containing protein [Deltaproteobacteria bacterium]|nr:PAS domain-containing protein [Deltaproteobacteria bacterium]MBW2013455.1 PAS domain-containing protein [Deltaproteobacteria bacterium]MBW2089753.1 PAS domain-containing protein [Deltaproteobacteria bacterium]MBW2320267.1 PAS domain-containing protein [Deltaproteobacteria bacterium]